MTDPNTRIYLLKWRNRRPLCDTERSPLGIHSGRGHAHRRIRKRRRDRRRDRSGDLARLGKPHAEACSSPYTGRGQEVFSPPGPAGAHDKPRNAHNLSERKLRHAQL